MRPKCHFPGNTAQLLRPKDSQMAVASKIPRKSHMSDLRLWNTPISFECARRSESEKFIRRPLYNPGYIVPPPPSPRAACRSHSSYLDLRNTLEYQLRHSFFTWDGPCGTLCLAVDVSHAAVPHASCPYHQTLSIVISISIFVRSGSADCSIC